jgi:hypothetical protein
MGAETYLAATAIVDVAPASIAAGAAAVALTMDEGTAARNEVAAAASTAGDGRGHAGPYTARDGYATGDGVLCPSYAGFHRVWPDSRFRTAIRPPRRCGGGKPCHQTLTGLNLLWRRSGFDRQ